MLEYNKYAIELTMQNVSFLEEIEWFLIVQEEQEVQQNTNKVTGIDAIRLTPKRQSIGVREQEEGYRSFCVCPRVLKSCVEQLCGILAHLLNLRLSQEKVLVLWTSCPVLVPKISHPSALSDHWPVTLTFHILKVLERLLFTTSIGR